MPPLHLLVRSGNHGHPGLLHYPTTAFCLSQSHSLLSCRTWTPKFSSRLRCERVRLQQTKIYSKEKWYAHVQSLKTNIMALFVHFICLKSVENIHFYVFLRQETDSTGSNFPIKIILWIFGVIASFSNKRSLHCFLSIGLRPIFQQWTIPHHLQVKTTWENLPQLCNRQLRAPVFSWGLQMWIQHLLVRSTHIIF